MSVKVSSWKVRFMCASYMLQVTRAKVLTFFTCILPQLHRELIELINEHYVNVSVLIKFSQKTSVFTLIILSSP